ncbi:MAG: YHS domain-containing protein [Burkholderiaceae bacterium]|nr:YHS domain-containing protein [Burkholderiaceae bacterium]
MDKRVERQKPDIARRYAAMTHDLQWDTSYQPVEKIFPFARYEGLRVHDWKQWEDAFHMTLDVWWRQQGEKEKRLYAVMDAYAQNNGQLGVSDARYVNMVKLLLQSFGQLNATLHRALAHAARNLPGDALRIAVQLQAAETLRHAQLDTHAASIYNKYFNGLHQAPRWFEQAWYLAPVKSFADDAATAGPFELVVAVGFGFDALLSDLLYVPVMSAAAHNGDLSLVSASFSAHADTARHKSLGIAAVKFLLQQDPANRATIQRWVDKWFWRSFRLMPLVAMMQDYLQPKRTVSWKEAWTAFVEAPANELFAELAPLGLNEPAGWEAACDAREHLSHQAWNAFYGHADALAFHTWVPLPAELDWLDRKYPDSFDRWYRPRLAHYAQREAAGRPYRNRALPMQCQVCQQPMIFTEPGSPRWIAYRETQHDGESFHFCSDPCRSIFSAEPGKYVQARLPSHEILRAQHEGRADPGASDPLQASLAGCGIVAGRDTGGFATSEDAMNFETWGGGQDMKEAQL